MANEHDDLGSLVSRRAFLQHGAVIGAAALLVGACADAEQAPADEPSGSGGGDG
jgi:hypothetical protein